MKRWLYQFVRLVVPVLMLTVLVGCNEANIASQNLSTAADNFEIKRRIVFYNGITGGYMLEITGNCSLGNGEDNIRKRTVTCKVGPKTYKKHILGLSDNVTYFAEQIDGANVSSYHYKVVFTPSAIIPDIDLR